MRAQPVALRPEVVRCHQCSDLGWLRKPNFGPETQWRTELVRCTCMEVQDKARLFERAQRASNLTSLLLNVRFDAYRVDQYNRVGYKTALAFANAPQGWLVLAGNTGTGKTFLLAAIANRLMYTTAHPLYVVVPDFLAYLRRGYEETGEDKTEQRMEQAKQIPVLLLDDLGVEKRSVWSDEQLYRLLNHRYNEALPTVIATNARFDDLEMRISSRMQDTGLSRVVWMTGPDYRQTDARERQRGDTNAGH